MKNVAVLTAFALFFRPGPGEFDSSRVLIPGNLPSKAKKMLMPGGQPGEEGGGSGRSWNWLIHKPRNTTKFLLLLLLFVFLRNVRIYFPYLVCFLQKTIARFPEEQKRSKPWTRADHRHVFSYFLRRLGSSPFSVHVYKYNFGVSEITGSLHSQKHPRN